MTAAALLSDLRARDVILRLEGGALTYDAPPGVLTSRDREAVAANRAALVSLLAASPSDSLTFDPEAPLVANLFDRVRLAWLRSARAGSAPEAGLAWLEAQARELAPDLGEDDLAVLVTRALGRLRALSPAPGRDLAERAWDLLGGEPGRQEEPLPALCLFWDGKGRPMESWLLDRSSIVAQKLKTMIPPVVPVSVPGTPWGRVDMPAGWMPRDLVTQIIEACPADLVTPDEASLTDRDDFACLRRGVL